VTLLRAEDAAAVRLGLSSDRPAVRSAAVEALATAADLAARAGVVVTLADWSALDLSERVALAQAVDAQRARSALLLADALAGGEARAAAAAAIDGGASARRMALEAAHARLHGGAP
jgi:hypothetical protein